MQESIPEIILGDKFLKYGLLGLVLMFPLGLIMLLYLEINIAMDFALWNRLMNIATMFLVVGGSAMIFTRILITLRKRS